MKLLEDLKNEYKSIDRELQAIIQKQDFWLGEELKYGLSDEEWLERSKLTKERNIVSSKTSEIIADINKDINLENCLIITPDFDAVFDINGNIKYMINEFGVIGELE